MVQWVFPKVDRWYPSSGNEERMVWIVCFGVPLYAWKENFFDILANVVGSLCAEIEVEPAIDGESTQCYIRVAFELRDKE
ncbi:hypothetical protein RIF29_25102 [Crotalaria pallida]|uniref:DUF4283 domain-containing protein n=1 Tax=Crotalaria pallida TaxID=3830 RepID=A0AAN9HZH6_CROPI